MDTDFFLVFGCLSFFAVIGIAVVVYEVAHRRRSAALARLLKPGDVLVASGKGRTSWSMWKREPSVLLVRTGEASYFLIGGDNHERIGIRGVVQDLVPSEALHDSRYYVGLVTAGGMVFFNPMQLPLTAKGKPRKMHRDDMPEHVLRGIKAAAGIDLYQLCWNCFSPRLADKTRCTHPDCADLEALEGELGSVSDEPAMARAGCIVGGAGGALAGLSLYGLAWVIVRLFGLPQATRDLIDQNWEVPVVAFGLLGYLYFFLKLRRDSMKSQNQPE